MSSSLGSDDNPGTRAQPVRSMEQAIALAQGGPKRVYACAETFTDPVMLPSGIELWGGLDCTNDWVYLGGDRRTILAPASDLIPLRVDAGPGSSIVADVRAEAADATEPSGSSIAVMVLAGAAVEFLRSELSAGHGAPGLPGESGGTGPAQAGTTGANGLAACSAVVVQGGAEVETVCGDLRSVGGQGGQGGINAGSDGLDGQPEPVPNPQGFGFGGDGETSAQQCRSGEEGKEGTAGAHGFGGSGIGRISSSGWRGEHGQDGVDGLPGQGGGGGGGRLGGPFLCGVNMNRGGAGGGSGGGGGCGGRGGMGGGYGGASIGLIALSGDVALRASSIITGRGGDGGTGGILQTGGTGGAGGVGGNAFSAAPEGCDGGKGGRGGNGGNGAGGLGGLSVGIAHPGGVTVTQEEVVIEIGEPGRGGLGGNPAIPGSTGEDGTAAAVLSFAQ
ncbi:MAG TPA: hypothetical protein VLS89_17680 [Candidatus Nanopelagicales bacterium]|nr:hypothetical protein [Candidatus Nanopelagicales bacterium]